MAFSFVQAAQSASGASPRTASLGVAPTEDNVLILQVSSSGADVTPTVPEGFTEIAGAQNTTVPTIRIFFKIAGAGESADVTVTFPSGSGHTIGVMEWSVGAGNTVEVDDAATQSNGSGDRICPSVTTTVADTFLACFVALGNIGSTADAAMTERWDTGSSPRIYCMTETQEAVGATGTRTATGTASANQASTVALKEVAAGGGGGIAPRAFMHNRRMHQQ